MLCKPANAGYLLLAAAAAVVAAAVVTAATAAVVAVTYDKNNHQENDPSTAVVSKCVTHKMCLLKILLLPQKVLLLFVGFST